MEPELQMMRWLWCLLSREFEPIVTLKLWDYMFSGIDESYIEISKYSSMYMADDYITSMRDPLIHLDYLCIAMILLIRDDLYGHDVD